MRSRLLVIAALAVGISFSATSSFAVHYWIGYTGVQKMAANVGGVPGTLRYLDVMIGSDETPQNAQAVEFVTYLNGTGPAGSCSTFNEVTTKVKPPARTVRFQIFYPNPKRPPRGPRDLSFESAIPVNYSFKAYTTGRMQIRNDFSPFKFPPGGTVSCVKHNPPLH